MFLKRLAEHDILGADRLFQRFIEPGSWNDVLFSQHVEHKTSPAASDSLFMRKKLRNPDLKFEESEQYTQRFKEKLQALEKNNKRIAKKLYEVSASKAELGSILNAFSLHENQSQPVSHAFEQLGVAMDSSSAATQEVSKKLSEEMGDLWHEYFLFSVSAEQVLRQRLQKHAYYEELGETLDSKRLTLANLEKGKVEEVSGFGKMVGKLTQMIDSDPEATRRNQIVKLRENIASLEKERDAVHTDMLKYSHQIQIELDRFQHQKNNDLPRIAETYARIVDEWLEKTYGFWKSARDQVQQ